ncbi:hypothetical protein [Luteimonas vadosa]|uniref:Uncharacterized protein n=1 Tax=Luteimonas vadosa TaxID=1165507 RepID=A0ABP9DZM9_9GAMM
MASEVSLLRLALLRAMYALIAIGLGLTLWPLIVTPPFTADAKSVIRALLGALAVLAAVGIRHPLKMLPLLLFELLWKVIWVAASALPMWLDGGLDDYASETLFACLIGVVLVPLAIPWGYVYRHYVKAPGDPWRAPRTIGGPTEGKTGI